MVSLLIGVHVTALAVLYFQCISNWWHHLYTPVSTHKMEATSRATSIPLSPSAPRCASHRRPAVLRVVHKEGENKGRQFYSCSLPRDTKCNFFEVKVEGSLSVFDLLLVFFAQSVSNLFTKHLNNWNKSLQLYIQANQTLFSTVAVGRLALPFLSPREALFNEDRSETRTQQRPEFLHLQLSKGETVWLFPVGREWTRGFHPTWLLMSYIAPKWNPESSMFIKTTWYINGVEYQIYQIYPCSIFPSI